MKKTIPQLTGDAQFASVEGRQIMDGFLVANELVRKVKQLKSQSMVLKIDFEKAFDCVNLNYLLSVMDQMGFRPKWTDWMLESLSSATVSVLLLQRN